MEEKKTWGPFSGRQLTAIVIAVCVAVVLVPAAAWGVAAAKSVIIQDGANAARKASVNALGQLGVNASGSAVTATPAASNQLVYGAPNVATTQSTGCADMGQLVNAYPNGGGGSKAVIVTSISIDVRTLNTTGNQAIGIVVSKDGACSIHRAVDFEPTSRGVYTFPFPSGLAVPASGDLYMNVLDFGGLGATATASLSWSGYLVAASAVPNNA